MWKTVYFIILRSKRGITPTKIDANWRQSNSELQIIFESNTYLRPNFLLNADFQISKSIFTLCNFSQCWKRRYYCFEVPYLNSFGVILIIALVVTCYYLLLHLSIYWPYLSWQYVDKRTDRLTSTIQSFTFVLRHVLTISTHCIGHLMRTAIC